MAVTTAPFTATNLTAFLPEIWTPVVLEELFAKTVMANFCTDLSEYARGGGTTFDVPDVFTNTLSIQTQSTQGAEVTTTNPTTVKIQLAINTHKYIAIIIGDKDMAQLAKSYDYNAIYARKGGGALAIALEDALTALWSSLTVNIALGSTAVALNDAVIRQGINALAAAKFDLRDCAFFFHPYIFWVQLAAVAKYYDASQIGLAAPGATALGFVRAGNFGPMDFTRGLSGQLYGVPIFVTPEVVSGLSTYRNLLLHKTAFGFGIQTPGGSTVRIQTENAIRNIGQLTVLDIVYGAVMLRDAGGVLLNGNTSYIMS